MLQLAGHGGVNPPVVTFPAVNIRDAVVEDVRIVVPSVRAVGPGGWWCGQPA